MGHRPSDADKDRIKPSTIQKPLMRESEKEADMLNYNKDNRFNVSVETEPNKLFEKDRFQFGKKNNGNEEELNK